VDISPTKPPPPALSSPSYGDQLQHCTAAAYSWEVSPFKHVKPEVLPGKCTPPLMPPPQRIHTACFCDPIGGNPHSLVTDVLRVYMSFHEPLCSRMTLFCTRRWSPPSTSQFQCAILLLHYHMYSVPMHIPSWGWFWGWPELEEVPSCR